MANREPSLPGRCHCRVHLTITRPLGPRHRETRDAESIYNLHGTTIKPRPLLGAIVGHRFRADSWALPLADRSCDAIECLDVLEYVRDDEAMIDEFARILRPGGTLRLRVPNAGPLAGLDAFNLYRYLSDITRRGRKPVETDEVGWRRHYDGDDLVMLFGSRFAVLRFENRRLGMSELVNAGFLALFRWPRTTAPRSAKVDAVVQAIERIEDRIKTGSIGTLLTVEAVRLESEPTIDL